MGFADGLCQLRYIYWRIVTINKCGFHLVFERPNLYENEFNYRIYRCDNSMDTFFQ